MKRVLFFGIFDPEYSRNRVLISGFQLNGWEVVLCRADPREHKGAAKFSKLYQLARKFSREHFDLVIVAYPGQSVAWIARLVFGRRIVCDAFVSLYDSQVFDRKVNSKWSLGALKAWLLDYSSTRMAGKVLLDTKEHIDYFVKTFGAAREKFLRVPVGTDDTVFFPRGVAKHSGAFKVHFHGTYIALQGIEHIIEAAHILAREDVHFTLIGRGQERPKIEALLTKLAVSNVTLTDSVPYAELPVRISEANVCLGIFGTTNKAARVIPNKVYEYAACAKPIITRDSPAIREFFVAGEDVFLCEAGNPQAIADAVMKLKSDPALCERLGAAARQKFERSLKPADIVRELIVGVQYDK